MEKAIVVLSGGQDSTTCLFWAKAQGFDVHALTFDYNQRHRIEIHSAMKVAQLAGIHRDNHEILEIGPILKGTSPLVNDTYNLEQYKDHQSLPGGLEKTFVPMRNQLFLTIAANRAVVLGAQRIITGVCQEDYGGYPDCRRIFIDALEHAIDEGTRANDSDPALVIETPLMYMTKANSIILALDLPGCYQALAWSHTSYDGQYPPIGKDHATLLRAKGFEEAMVPDPLVLRAWLESKMELPGTSNYQMEPIMKTFLTRAGLKWDGSPRASGVV